ncbi:MAG TPA: bifunctional serine/threonine-protein kinase/formylglycine-generating enzyme family protein [Bryobacteraceae bacterium]|jgi:serine/threonine-protein kinase
MQLPASIGKYELLEFLGGGMSHVYRAHDTVIDRPVVVKLLTQEACSDSEAKARFLQEARLAGNIQHENIVSVFDFGEHEGRPYIVMEYLKGEDLRDAIKGNRAGSLLERLKIALQIAEALNYIQGRAIVHRDIKPENIHIDPTGRVKLMDFGIAKTADLSLTKTGMSMGTPYYMSPEQAAGRGITVLVDVYAYGMVLFELLTGVRGVTGESMETVFYQILHQPLDLSLMENAGVPAPVRDLVMRCTAKDPAARPQGFAPIVESLKANLSGASSVEKTQAVPQVQLPEAPVEPPVRATISPTRSIVKLSIVTYALVAIVTAISVILWIHYRPPEQIPGMVYIPAGTFLYGPDKTPVQLRAFYIDETEVTNSEFAYFCRTVGQQPQIHCVMPENATPNFPVVNITYALAKAFAKSQGKRLPTAQEWERAARGTNGDLFPWGNDLDATKANFRGNPTRPVPGLVPARGTFPPYRGLYHLFGNAAEMVEGEIQPSQAVIDHFNNDIHIPVTATEPWIATRGGSFQLVLQDKFAWDHTSIPARFSGPDIGFRCVKDP